MQVAVETNPPPALVPDTEVGAETAAPPTLVGRVFSLFEPAPMLLMKAGAETDTPLSCSAIASKDPDRLDRRRECGSVHRRIPS